MNTLPQGNINTAADAKVACPHNGISLVGVNHRSLNVSPKIMKKIKQKKKKKKKTARAY